MNKKSYVIILVLMPLALVGLILIQVYWVKSAIDNKEEAFAHSVGQVLSSVSESIEKKELNKYLNRFAELKIKDSVGVLKASQIRDLVFIQEDKNTKETFIYRHGVLEEDYTVPSRLFDILGEDSTKVRDYISEQTTSLNNSNIIDAPIRKPTNRQIKSDRITSFDKIMFEELFREIADKLPLVDRINQQELTDLLYKELKNRGIDLNFEYAVYDTSKSQHKRLTNVKSQNFSPQKKSYQTRLFTNDQSLGKYELVVVFPNQRKYLLSTVGFMSFLAFVFTAIIIWTFIKTLVQLRTQKQISEMKTDFINNMTHEFKTPIATINLALDAMKNPAVIASEDRRKDYLKMIRDENRRMLAQVENVLRISKLDRNQLDIEKEPQDAHELIENAIAHIQLLLDDRKGVIKKHFQAENADILASDLHFTNVIVNILENAIKYSPNPPDIDVYTQVEGNYILIRVQDKGAGMSKAVLKKIFEKFYREHTGDLHNVKGHGLGLAYVKRIVNDHQGQVYAESEKGKGSTFFIKIPLII